MDYEYLGYFFKWGPDQIDQLPWSMRKQIVDDHKTVAKDLEASRQMG